MNIALVGQPTSPLHLPYDGSDSVGIVIYHLARSLARRAVRLATAALAETVPRFSWAHSADALFAQYEALIE